MGNNLLVVGIVEDALYEICYLYHHVFLGATCGDGWCAQTDTTGLEGATLIEGYHVLVDGDIGSHKYKFCHLTCEIGILAAKIHQHGVVVGTT